jgi:hypothetical protein
MYFKITGYAFFLSLFISFNLGNSDPGNTETRVVRIILGQLQNSIPN